MLVLNFRCFSANVDDGSVVLGLVCNEIQQLTCTFTCSPNFKMSCKNRAAHLAKFLLLTDALSLFVLLCPLSQVGVVPQAVEKRRHFWPSVHLLLLKKEESEQRGGKDGGDIKNEGKDQENRKKNKCRERIMS